MCFLLALTLSYCVCECVRLLVCCVQYYYYICILPLTVFALLVVHFDLHMIACKSKMGYTPKSLSLSLSHTFTLFRCSSELFHMFAVCAALNWQSLHQMHNGFLYFRPSNCSNSKYNVQNRHSRHFHKSNCAMETVDFTSIFHLFYLF